MNRGFTLIELIGTVVILAVISLIAFPAILNMLNNSNNEVEKQTQEIVKSAALEYVNDHKDDYPSGQSKTVSVKSLMEGGYIAASMICKNCEIYDDSISVVYNGEKYNLTYEVTEGDESCPAECQ